MAAKKNHTWEQATKENLAVGNVARVETTDGMQTGIVKSIARNGIVSIQLDGEGAGIIKAKITDVEANFEAGVKASDAEKPAKAAPVRERKATITRVVGGRSYEYQNLGKGHIDNGDAVAVELRDKTLDEVYALTAKRLGVDETKLRATYASNNLGRQRMTLGNLLRSHAKATEAGVAYVAPFQQAEVKAANKKARDEKAAKAKAEREQKAADAKAERDKKEAERKAAAEEKAKKAADAKAEREAAAKAKADKATADKKAADAKK